MNESIKHRPTIVVALLLCIACATFSVRLIHIQQRPMHSDEAVQAVKTGILLETGHYEYDPNDCHGPSLYYLTLPFLWTSGTLTLAESSECNYRIVPLFFSIALILLLMFLRDALSGWALIGAALLMALSPAMSFYSRFYVQEMPLVFFTYLAMVAGWRFLRSRATGWALATGLALGLMFVTKETCVIAYFSMFVALVWEGICSLRSGRDLIRGEIKESKTLFQLLLAACAGFLMLLFFYSSFFSNMTGLMDSVLAYKTYVKRGYCAGDHIHPWYFYLKMLFFSRYQPGPFWSEALILALAAVGYGALLGNSGDNDRSLVRFIAISTALMIVIYSLIPYKTPWCLLSFLMGLILMAGVGLDFLLRKAQRIELKFAVLVLFALAAMQLGQQNYQTNFIFYSDNRNPYVYAHPTNDVKRLAERIAAVAEVCPEKEEMVIKIVSQDYWPLPWYLREFPRVGYWSEPIEDPDASVVIASVEFEESVKENMKCPYRTQYFGLRPDVVLAVFIQEPLWDAMMERKQH